MKKFIFGASMVMLVITLSVFISCADSSGPVEEPAGDTNAACLMCHSADSPTGELLVAAAAGYENSGHYNGPRALDPNVAATGHIYVFHGSNAMYANGGGCGYCHTHQGFIDYVENGVDDGDYPFASQPECFTCHMPHESYGFGLRTTDPVILADEVTTYDYGDGNLCVICHKSRRTSDYFLDDDWPGSISSHAGPHHGPQADFLMGVNHWAYGSNDYVGVGDHALNADESCVTCHMFGVEDGRLSGTFQMGGHGMYLTADVHGSVKDLGKSCIVCHDEADEVASGDFEDNKFGSFDWDGDGSVDENMLDEIMGLRDTLISYMGNGTAYWADIGDVPGDVVGDGAIVAIGGGDVTTGEWNLDWEFAGVDNATEVQAQAFWNFKYFIEDKSRGIHNPIFAAQILYDAIDNLNDNAAAGLTLGATRP